MKNLLAMMIVLALPQLAWASEIITIEASCHRLLQALNNEPLLAQIRQSQADISQAQMNDFPTLQFDSIDKLEELPLNRTTFMKPEVSISAFRGWSTFAIYKGWIDGKQVFIKVSPRRLAARDPDLLKEARWLTYLASTHVVPKFFGFTEVNGRLGMVTEYIEGYQIYFSISKRIDLIKKMWSLEKRKLIAMQFLTIGKILKQLGPIQMTDAQYRLTPEGVPFLIDMESYLWQEPDYDFRDPINWSRKLAAQILETTPE